MHLWMEMPGFPAPKTDLLIANLYFQVLDEILGREDFFTRPYYLLSGLLGHESHLLQERLRGRLTQVDQYQENFWFTHLFARP